MRRIDVHNLVLLGQALQEASKVDEKSTLIDAWISTYELGAALRTLLSGAHVEMGIARRYAQDLLGSVDEFYREFDEWQNSPPPVQTKLVDWSKQHNFKKQLEEFKTVLAAELRDSAVYHVSRVGIYSTNSLIANACEKFDPKVRQILSPDTQEQFHQSAQCLAYQLHTACAFHMMRAIETALLDLMRVVARKNFASLNANWGAYITELEKIRSSKSRKKASKETIDLLRQIKDNHRNPVMHTEATLDAQEAMDVFDLGAVVISHLVAETKALA